jgi:hypothetical protein
MSEQPAPYSANPILKLLETGLENTIFNSRWLMAPFYVGLVISLAVLLLKFFMMLWEFILHAPRRQGVRHYPWRAQPDRRFVDRQPHSDCRVLRVREFCLPDRSRRPSRIGPIG